jgi:hypothetical protein
VNEHQSENRQREATDELNDVAAEVAQAAITIITAESVLEQIPIAKIGLAVWKTVSSIRDQLLMKKLEIFLRNLASIAAEDRRSMIQRLNDDPDFKEDVGDHIVELIDRIDGQRKPGMIGAVFAAFAHGEINVKMLRRLNSAIERLQSIEIHSVRQLSDNPIFLLAGREREGEDVDAESLQALTNAGLAMALAVLDGTRFTITETGKVFVRLNLDTI